MQVFEHSLQQTSGDDLAKLLLLKSPSSEVWFDRRTNFTRSNERLDHIVMSFELVFNSSHNSCRSLAVMSMVGYVLGLGERKYKSEVCLMQLLLLIKKKYYKFDDGEICHV
jgi:FKBP12-rapamycin complex-associated protein